ncbi:hypothetical protein Tco_1112573 [Tanacetum coccineum]|uniref:Uncharacterized protein n=1 Tax=Tanacetum coccineum TaxID=301880 RepID=A0ABQ5IPR0_9ASTR
MQVSFIILVLLLNTLKALLFKEYPTKKPSYISWDDIQAKVDADLPGFVKRCKLKEQSSLQLKKIATLFQSTPRAKRKHFAAKSADEKRNTTTTLKNQTIKTMITNLRIWRPVEDLDLVLWNDLKTMFKPHVEDEIWKLHKRYKVLSWKLFDLCGVHCLSFQSGMIYMLVEKRYPLTPPTFTDILNKKLQDSLKLNELMELCTNLQQRLLDLETKKTTQANEIASFKRRVKKLEQKKRLRTYGLKRLYKVGLTARVESSRDEEDLGKDASKQGRRIHDIDAYKDITLVNDQDDADMFDVNTLTGDEVLVEQEVVAKDVNLIVYEVTFAQALAALKSVKPKVKANVVE